MPVQAQREMADAGSNGTSGGIERQMSKRKRLSKLGSTLKDAPRKLLTRMDVLPQKDDRVDADDVQIKGITDDPAFNIGMVLRKRRDPPQSAATKIQTMADAVLHPRETAKKRAAHRVKPPTQYPFLTDEADQNLLAAQADLQSSASGQEGDEPGRSRQELVERVEELEKDRASMRNAWITSRHVKRACVVRKGEISRPRYNDYREQDEEGKYQRFQLGRYIGHLLLWMSDDFGPAYTDVADTIEFKRGTLLHNLERFLIATTPWQNFGLHVRKVYLWEDVRLTGRWILTYLFLIYVGQVMTALYLFIVFTVVKNRYFPTSQAELLHSHERAMDHGVRVRNISELIKRHGTEDWLDPLLDELGPLIQQQVGDMADFIEIMYNFYKWENPRATVMCLLFWLCCAATSGLSSTEFGNKVGWFVGGIYFFGSRPIASHYPRYRHLVSIWRWIFWDIPTNGELAFYSMQNSALEHMRERGEHQASMEASGDGDRRPVPQIRTKYAEAHSPGTSVSRSRGDTAMDEDSDDDQPRAGLSDDAVLSFQGSYKSRPGRLVITYHGVRFDFPAPPGRAEKRETAFAISYSSVREMRKAQSVQDTLTKKMTKMLVPAPMDGLHIEVLNGHDHKVEGMRKRDEAFNTLIAFSGVRWQVQEPYLKDDAKYAGNGKRKPVEKGSALAELGKL